MTPTFLVRASPHRREEHEYALSVLLGEWLGATYSLQVEDGLAETRLRPAGTQDGPVIVMPDILLARSTAWLAPTSLPGPIQSVVIPPSWLTIDEPLPLLYANPGLGGALVRRDGDRVVLGWDLLGSLVFMLGRYEEACEHAPVDEHGRFPSSASVLASCGLLATPILDMYLHAFGALLAAVWPSLPVAPAGYEGIAIGHDVDHPSSSMRWRGRERIRTLAGDLVRRHDAGLALHRAASFVSPTRGLPRSDPYNTFDFLMRASEEAGVHSTFFFFAREADTAGRAIPHGSSYRLSDPWAEQLLSEIARRGHHVGLHGSYDSYVDAGRLRAQWQTLQAACDDLPEGVLRPTVRQHYLRWRPGATWRAQARAGLRVDETLAFADTIGYRAGTARRFPAFDVIEHRRLPLTVVPLLVMDSALERHAAATGQDPRGAVLDLARRTHRFGGTLSLLWHNSFLQELGARRAYAELLAALTSPGQERGQPARKSAGW